MRFETFDRRGDINDGRVACGAGRWAQSASSTNRYPLLRHHLRPTVFAPHHH